MMTDQTESSVNAQGKNTSQIINFMQQYAIWVIFAACLVFFTIATEDFFTFSNLTNILLQMAPVGIMGVGMTLLMISGNFDLSVGYQMAFTAALSVGLQQVVGIPLAILGTIAGGLIIGTINGFFVAKVKINPFIVTLAAMIGVKGLMYVYTGEEALVCPNFAFAQYGNGQLWGIPLPAIVLVIIALIGEYVLQKTNHGREAYAIGGNEEAAKNAGIKVQKHIFINYLIMSVLAAIAGITIGSRMNAATPTLGRMTHIIVIASTALGGTKLTGGFGSVFRTIGGVLVVGMVRNGMNLLDIHTYYNMLMMGLILILVIYMSKQLYGSE